MTVYSGTYAPTPQSAPVDFKDPLAEAREKLRQAARLPFHAHQPHSWRVSFRQLAGEARAEIRRHIWTAELPDSPLHLAENQEPRLLSKVETQRNEHESFAHDADLLVDAASTPEEPDIWKMIELGEKAILLEMALARHHNRLMQLVYETTLCDLGEAG